MGRDEKGHLLERRAIHDGRVVKLAIERVRLPNGNVAELEVIHHQGAAAAVPVDGAGNVWLVRQYRHAAGDWLLEVPAGKLDAGEPPERCAEREVEEETGQRPGKLDSLGWIFTTPGFTDERIWLYLATDLEPSAQDLQHDEVLAVERMPLDEAVRLAASGEIRDAKSVCALLRARHFLGRDKKMPPGGAASQEEGGGTESRSAGAKPIARTDRGKRQRSAHRRATSATTERSVRSKR